MNSIIRIDGQSWLNSISARTAGRRSQMWPNWGYAIRGVQLQLPQADRVATHARVLVGDARRSVRSRT